MFISGGEVGGSVRGGVGLWGVRISIGVMLVVVLFAAVIHCYACA